MNPSDPIPPTVSAADHPTGFPGGPGTTAHRGGARVGVIVPQQRLPR
ncbi:MAG: hypothetical protein HY302_09215 [Opitutae bacterium]|nr:hypothetical protein [Opitutae bacterium]